MNWIGLAIALLAGASLTVVGAAGADGPAPEAKAKPVTLRFWGHACFTLTDGQGSTVLIDPYHKSDVGYRPFEVEPDLVLIGHEHFDHSDTSWVKGKPLVLKGVGSDGNVRSIDKRVKSVRVRTVGARHWSDKRLQGRGNVAIFVIEAGGLRFVHVSDLGHVLSDEQAKAIGQPDVLIVPVGGFFTIDAEKAFKVVKQLAPRRYVIPMHYKTTSLVRRLRSRLAGPDKFLQQFGEDVVRLRGNELVIDPAKKPDKLKAVLMAYLPGPKPAGTKQ